MNCRRQPARSPSGEIGSTGILGPRLPGRLCKLNRRSSLMATVRRGRAVRVQRQISLYGLHDSQAECSHGAPRRATSGESPALRLRAYAKGCWAWCRRSARRPGDRPPPEHGLTRRYVADRVTVHAVGHGRSSLLRDVTAVSVVDHRDAHRDSPWCGEGDGLVAVWSDAK